MQFNNILILRDGRVNGLSISSTISTKEYVDWFENFGQNNKLDDQRPVMKTRSAIMIRKRLIEDLKLGAIIPPIVMGLSTDMDITQIKEENVNKFLDDHIKNATVIDGMQRTEALKEALSGNPDIGSKQLRIDFWITSNATSLIYRMLVLNTGQTPWDVKRQLEVIYKPLIEECQKKVNGISIKKKNDNQRRKNAGEYQASSIVELFLAFSSRKESVNTADKLADDFTRLDVTEMTATPDNSDIFYECIALLYSFDLAVSLYNGDQNQKIDGDQIYSGIDLFTSMPAKVGFIVALAQLIMGRPGTEIKEDKDKKLTELRTKCQSLCNRLRKMQQNELSDFLAFGTLNEVLKGLPVKKIGDEQRKFYYQGFTELFKSTDEIQNLNIAWRAY